MLEAEHQYETYDKDAQAVIFAFKKFRIYLSSSNPFKSATDHKGLSYNFKKKDVHDPLERWMDFIAEFDFEIIYRPGKDNVAADFIFKEPKW